MAGPSTVTAKGAAGDPTASAEQFAWRLRRLLFGRILRTEEELEERLSKVKALATFSSDNLSSVAYATELIMFTLLSAEPPPSGWSCGLRAYRRHLPRDRGQLSPDDPGLSQRRRQLHRGQENLGSGPAIVAAAASTPTTS